MDRHNSLGDVVAISAVASICGGFLTAAGFAALLLGDGWMSEPFSSAGAAFSMGFVGVILSLFSAWPVGIAIGGVIARFAGTGHSTPQRLAS